MTDREPYWVRLQFRPIANETGSIDLDLQKVTEVWQRHLTKDGVTEVENVRVRYENCGEQIKLPDGRLIESDGSIRFDGYTGAQFLKFWAEFLNDKNHFRKLRHSAVAPEVSSGLELAHTIRQ